MNAVTTSRLLMTFASVAILGALILLGGLIVVPGLPYADRHNIFRCIPDMGDGDLPERLLSALQTGNSLRQIVVCIPGAILLALGFYGYRTCNRMNILPNKASHATSEPAPGAASSAHQG